jgi:subtilisin
VFLRGLAWAVERGFDVINLSLGSGKRDWALPFYELCDEAYYRGSLLVTAANNIARPSYPSLYGAVTSVACNVSEDPHEFHANPEPPTEFLARGINVQAAWRGGTTRTVTGNSFAAPHIAGHAARVRAKHPELRPFQIKTALWACSANVRAAHAAGATAPARADDAAPTPRAAKTSLHSLGDLLERYPELAAQAGPDKPPAA